MTNREKFIEIFGQEPDTDVCPVACISFNGDKCPYNESYCISGYWWSKEFFDKYKEEKEKK